jgi:hypothetical protein
MFDNALNVCLNVAEPTRFAVAWLALKIHCRRPAWLEEICIADEYLPVVFIESVLGNNVLCSIFIFSPPASIRLL